MDEHTNSGHKAFDSELIREAVALAETVQKKLHEIPEDSFKEEQTTAVIREYCRLENVCPIELSTKTGAAAYLAAGTGCTGTCLSAGTGRAATVLLRADIDAVPTPDGPRHLCGHDHHTASLIGAMHYLAHRAEDLPVNVAFVFQPAEECTLGAKTVIEGGLLEALPQVMVACFGIHNRPQLPVGSIAVHSGPLMAAKTDYRVTFTGRSGHLGSPQHTIDPILAGAAFVQAVQSIIPRNLDPMEPAVCGVYSFISGDSSNDPPREAVLTGSFRSFDKEIHETIRKRVEELAVKTAEAYRCGIKLDWLLEVPPIVNSFELYDTAVRAAKSVCGKENITDTKPTLASDDFAEFASRMPGFYYWVGSGSAPWHDPAFAVGEGYQAVAVPLLVETILSYEEEGLAAGQIIE